MKSARDAIAEEVRRIPTGLSGSTIGATRALYESAHGREPYDGIAIVRDLPYGEHERQRLDVFTARDAVATEQRPVLVFVHGGGFIAGDKHTANSPYYDNIAVWAVRQGFVGVNVTYRLAPSAIFPSGAEDVALAVRTLIERAEAFDGNAKRIVLFGQSAGAAHVASFLARTKDPSVAGAILFSGVYDFAAMAETPNVQAYIGSDAEGLAVAASLPKLLKCGVPLLVASAELDPPMFVHQFRLFEEAFAAASSERVETLVLRGHNHLSQVTNIGARDSEDPFVTEAVRRFVLTASNATTSERI